MFSEMRNLLETSLTRMWGWSDQGRLIFLHVFYLLLFCYYFFFVFNSYRNIRYCYVFFFHQQLRCVINGIDVCLTMYFSMLLNQLPCSSMLPKKIKEPVLAT